MGGLGDIELFLSGRSGFLGSIIYEGYSRTPSMPITIIERGNLSFFSKSHSGRRRVVLNAVGATKFKTKTETRNLEELYFSNVQYAKELYEYSSGQADQFIQISSSLLCEKVVSATSDYLESKRVAETTLLNLSKTSPTTLTIIRSPSIWSSYLYKPGSLFDYLYKSDFPFELAGLREACSICHLAPEKTLFDLINRALEAKDNLIEPTKQSYLRTTPKRLIESLNKSNASGEVELKLRDLLFIARNHRHK